MSHGAALLLLLGTATTLVAQGRPLVLRRGNRTLVVERVQLSVQNARLISEGKAVVTAAGPELVSVDLRSNTAEITVSAAQGRFHQIQFDLVPKRGWSVQIVGTMDTTEFDLELPLKRTVSMPLLIPRRVKEPQELKVRVRLNASQWFRNARSGALLDPLVSRELIVERIEASLTPVGDR